MLSSCTNLTELWSYVDSFNKEHFPENPLLPVLGNGKTLNPKIMFVLINPTKVNISSSETWRGPRFPFVGVKHFWKIFHKAGLFNNALMHSIEEGRWSVGLANEILQHLQEREFYITNLVKWTGHDATLPDSKKVKMFLPVLMKEIELVKPRYIVTFGTMPFEALTNQKIKLADYYTKCMKTRKLDTYPTALGPVIPCYFPVGRGKPKEAIELLKLTMKL